MQSGSNTKSIPENKLIDLIEKIITFINSSNYKKTNNLVLIEHIPKVILTASFHNKFLAEGTIISESSNSIVVTMEINDLKNFNLKQLNYLLAYGLINDYTHLRILYIVYSDGIQIHKILHNLQNNKSVPI